MKQFKILKNTYIDSVTLMSSTSKFMKEYDLNELVLLMGTEMNKEMIESVGLFSDEMKNTTPNDLILAAEGEPLQKNLFDEILDKLTSTKKEASSKEITYSRVEELENKANIAIISVPGLYAAYEAREALNKNMHVMMFSDNVSIEDEKELKEIAVEKGLLMMGPDCGTSIINQKGLCFANDVTKGEIGLVAASGTGLQEVTVIIDQFGGGISQAIGVGGRDLKEEIGGLMMLHSMEALANDPETRVIGLISKPPAASVQDKIIAKAKTIDKPVVVCLLDSGKTGSDDNLHYVETLAEAAIKTLELSGKDVAALSKIDAADQERINKAKMMLSPTQTKLKGLFCGGTLTAETLSILRGSLQGITSNVAKKESEKMTDPLVSDGHNLVDLGDDIFTNGKPHPMIEPTIRLKRILEEAKNPETAVILLDFELGFGSHEDPVGVTIDTIINAKKMAAKEGRNIVYVAYVLGTDNDFQNKAKSIELLEDNNVIIGKTNAHAAFIAAEILKGGNQ